MDQVSLFLDHAHTKFTVAHIDLVIETAGQTFLLKGEENMLSLTVNSSFTNLRQLSQAALLIGAARRMTALCVKTDVTVNLFYKSRLIGVCGKGVKTGALGRLLGIPSLRLRSDTNTHS